MCFSSISSDMAGNWLRERVYTEEIHLGTVIVLISGARVSLLKCVTYLVLNILATEHAESFKSAQIMVSFSDALWWIQVTLAQEK